MIAFQLFIRVTLILKIKKQIHHIEYIDLIFNRQHIM